MKRQPKYRITDAGPDAGKQRYGWVATAANGRDVVRSSEGYRRKIDAKRMARMVLMGNMAAAIAAEPEVVVTDETR